MEQRRYGKDGGRVLTGCLPSRGLHCVMVQKANRQEMREARHGFQVRTPRREQNIARTLGVSQHDEAARWLKEHEEAPGYASRNPGGTSTTQDLKSSEV